MTPAEHVRLARRADQRLRAIRRNRGRTAATTYARDRWGDARAHHVCALVHDHPRLAGLLHEEFDLALRIAACEFPRPELKARLTSVRRQVREALREVES